MASAGRTRRGSVPDRGRGQWLASWSVRSRHESFTEDPAQDGRKVPYFLNVYLNILSHDPHPPKKTYNNKQNKKQEQNILSTSCHSLFNNLSSTMPANFVRIKRLSKVERQVCDHLIYLGYPGKGYFKQVLISSLLFMMVSVHTQAWPSLGTWLLLSMMPGLVLISHYSGRERWTMTWKETLVKSQRFLFEKFQMTSRWDKATVNIIF